MSHGFERMKKNTMTDSNQTSSQPAQQLNHREEVLKDFPEAFCVQGGRSGELLILSRAGTIGRSFKGVDDAWASVQLTAAPAPQTSIALHPSLTPEMPTGFAPEPVEKYVPEWVQRVDLATGPVDHTASAPAYDRPPDPVPQTAPEPVERELQRVESELSAKGLPPLVHPAPSEPEVPPPYLSDHRHEFWCTTDEQQCDGACKREHICSMCHKKRKDCPEFELTLLEVRERQLLDALRENQQLREQLEASRHAGEVLMHTSNANFDRFKAAEQQLAQIKEYKGERPHSYIASHYADSHLVCSATEVNKLLNAQDATIAALRLDNAQKGKRIAELEGGK